MTNPKIVITVGCFDCFHEGHYNLLANMAKEGKVLVIVHDDESIYENKHRFPVQPHDLRMKNVQRSRMVTYTYSVNEADPSTLLRTLIEGWRIGGHEVIYMRGDDWPDFPGRKALEELGVEIKLIPYTKGVSTTQIRKEIL